MSSFFISSLAVLAPLTIYGQVIFPGSCPNATVVQNFNVTRYIGKWYEYERFFFVTEFDDRCVSANYTIKPDGHVKVFNQGLGKSSGAISTSVGDAYSPDPNVPGKLLVQFSGGPPGPYWVLDTDYTGYSVVWSCFEPPIHIAHSEITWILSRDRAGISEDRKNKIYKLLQGFKIDTNKFQKIDQTNCPSK